MNDSNLNNKQFVTIAIIIVLCGIAILGHDYFLAKKAGVYEEMSILLSQEPEYVENDIESETNSSSNTNTTTTTNNNTTNNSSGDTSGRVAKKNIKYNYIGRLKIPAINFNRGFVKYGTRGNNVDQNIAIMNGSSYPNDAYSNFIIAGHNGSRWNAFFTNLDKLSLGDTAIVTYKGRKYTYKLVKRYKDLQKDGVTLYRHSSKKQLTLITCARPDYHKYYLVLVFELENEQKI